MAGRSALLQSLLAPGQTAPRGPAPRGRALLRDATTMGPERSAVLEILAQIGAHEGPFAVRAQEILELASNVGRLLSDIVSLGATTIQQYENLVESSYGVQHDAELLTALYTQRAAAENATRFVSPTAALTPVPKSKSVARLAPVAGLLGRIDDLRQNEAAEAQV